MKGVDGNITIHGISVLVVGVIGKVGDTHT